MVGVFHEPARLSEVEHNPLAKRASSATLNAQSTTTGLGWDPEMPPNVPTALFACPSVESERKTSAAGEQIAKKKKERIFYMDIHIYLS